MSDSVAAMREFARANLPELCTELLEWHSTSLLRDGKMRELARLCTFDPSNTIRHAERVVELEALKRVSGDSHE
jgi:hypothetical protein